MKTKASSSWKWADILWAHITPLIKTGGQFYLSIDSETLFRLGRTIWPDLQDSADAFQRFCVSCNELFLQKRAQVRLNDEALLTGPEIYSRSICLAVQQVLVVERMLRDGTYSENAYFPRYREILGIEETISSSCPLDRIEFAKVWETLKGEILSIPGATSETITFRKGTGINLNRQYPISQALFTAHDLAQLRPKWPDGRDINDESHLFRFFDEHRSLLGSRARDLITINEPVFRARLCAQFRSYLQSPAPSLQVERIVRKSRDTFSIVAYPDTDEVLEDRFIIYLRTPTETKSVSAWEDEGAILRNHCVKEEVIFLTEEDDHFGQSHQVRELSAGDQVLVLVPSEACSRLTSIFEEFGIQVADNSARRMESNLPPGIALLYFDAFPPSNFHLEVLDGRIRKGDRLELSPLELVGGLNLDRRSRKYLSGYPPVGLRYSGEKLDDSEIIEVSGQEILCGDFFLSLRGVLEFARYAISYRGRRMEFIVEKVDNKSLQQALGLGFPIIEGRFNPIPLPLTQPRGFLKGTHLLGESNSASDKFEKLRPHLHLLHPSVKCPRVKISEEEANLLSSAVTNEMPEAVAQLITNFLLENLLAPAIFKKMAKAG